MLYQEQFGKELSETMELNKREQTAHLIATSEVKKRHEKLRTLVGFVKQRVNELKVAADSKLEEARALYTRIEERSLEVEAKLHAVDAKLAEIKRKSSEIEAKESSLMRECMSFYNERDAHERNLSNQREDLRERERKLQEGEENLAEVRRLLNQREELAKDGDRVFKQKQLVLEEAQKRIDVANLELKSREDDVSTRMENLALKEKEAAVISKNLEVREKELLELEEKLKPKEQHEMMQTTKTTNWFDLPLVLQVNILHRVVTIEKLWNLPKVCRDWRKICKEPSMWRVIYMDSDQCSDCWPYLWPSGLRVSDITYRKLCKNAVDRSQGQLVDITMVGFCDDELLDYVADRSPKLRILEIAYGEFSYLSEALKKLPKLEELIIYCALGLQLDKEFGNNCQHLKTLKLNHCPSIGDEDISAISKNLPELRRLEIHMNYTLTNTGLEAILDECPFLECSGVDLKGVSGKRLEQIRCVLHAEPVDTQPYTLDSELLMDPKTWRKILDGKIMARMSDSDTD